MWSSAQPTYTYSEGSITEGRWGSCRRSLNEVLTQGRVLASNPRVKCLVNLAANGVDMGWAIGCYADFEELETTAP